ncbi:protein phosphatase PhpP [Abditibacteriota bacterium]|nr:protein phosphatase PhpP [Abditibacteriota bacterium]
MFSNPFKRAPESPVDAAPSLDPESQPQSVAADISVLMEADGDEPSSVEENTPSASEPIVTGLENVAVESTAPEIEVPAVMEEVRVVKPLFVGSFLNGELEVVEVLEHGPINFYRANAGGWGENDWKWVWERASVSNEPIKTPGASFFVPATRFVGDEREYAVYDWDERDPFSEWRAPANDDTFLEMIAPLARALEALESAGLKARIEPDSLWFQEGELGFYGFGDFAVAGESDALKELATLSSTVAKAHLAPRATLRLDDVWASLPFSVELKEWAHQLEGGTLVSMGEAIQGLDRFAAPSRTQIEVQTDVGLERDHNEDGVLSLSLKRASQNGAVLLELLAVADGMGGHEAGEEASQCALDALQDGLLARQDANWNDNGVALLLGHELVEAVNAAVIAQNEAPPFASMRQKPGTTLVFALRLGRRLVVGNVGDSRLYRWSQSRGLELLTKDHSYVQDLLDAGKITPDEAWGHPDSSIITSHIGMPRGMQSDVTLRLLSSGERIFCVSDGVVDTLRDPQIEEVVASTSNAAELCSRLVDAANEAGGIDNISVAALFCE